MVTNPILPGFRPDPSILRIGEDYWIATSTFEWLPGIELHHSRDLVHWRLVGHALTRPSQVNLAGVAPSKGVWAPSLSRDPEGTCHLCYSLVRNITDNYFDLDNWVVTAPSPEGPWSDPVYLNSSGFDPSLFWDEGRAWLVNLEWDFRQGYEHPGALVLQEYSPSEGRLVGTARRIYRGGSDLGCLEGPHLFRHGDWYYLMAAEGGTGYGHGVTLARSQHLAGPWQPDPTNPIVTSAAARFSERGDPAYLKPEKFNPASRLQKSGHGSVVHTPDGRPYLVHLCSRPALPSKRCVLGRETALQQMEWVDGWLRLAGGGNLAREALPDPGLPPAPWPPESTDFGESRWSPHWVFPRGLADESWVTLTQRPGWLGLRGRQSLFSPFDQSTAVRRVEHHDFRAEVEVDFSPQAFQEMAGLVCLYDTLNFYYLRVYFSETHGAPALGLFTCLGGRRQEYPEARVALSRPALEGGRVRLGVEARGGRLQFSWTTGTPWAPLGPDLDQTALSDEACGGFTGSFVGVTCQDLARREAWAWFRHFTYRGR